MLPGARQCRELPLGLIARAQRPARTRRQRYSVQTEGTRPELGVPPPCAGAHPAPRDEQPRDAARAIARTLCILPQRGTFHPKAVSQRPDAVSGSGCGDQPRRPSRWLSGAWSLRAPGKCPWKVGTLFHGIFVTFPKPTGTKLPNTLNFF